MLLWLSAFGTPWNQNVEKRILLREAAFFFIIVSFHAEELQQLVHLLLAAQLLL